MADDKPRPRDRKSWLIAPAVIAGVVVAILLAVLLRHDQVPPPKPAPVPAPPPPRVHAVAVPAPPVPKLPADRRDLIDAARASGAELAGTGMLPKPDEELVGRDFSIRIPFGCNGLQIGPVPDQLSVSYDPSNKSMTLTARPNVWTGLPLVQALPGISGIDTVEGFWIPRPWAYLSVCPPRIEYPPVASPTPPTAQTLGLARFFGPGDSRILQHAEHPFTVTRKLPADDLSALSHGYFLLLSGRIASYQDGRALHCWMESADHHPICIFAVTFDHVAFEDATTGETLAEWHE